MKAYLSKLRKDYSLMGLDENSMHEDPLIQMEHWFADAANANITEPNAMTLSTVDADGKPHARIVLLRNLDARGLVFYTNYDSNKGQELAQNPNVALTFFWVDLERQIRIEGSAQKISLVESTEYFQSRPLDNQLSAWASPQSQIVPNRAALETLKQQMEQKFKGLEILDKPPFWGGYRVTPTMLEFWQGRPGRLHDRVRYSRTGNEWVKNRLAP